MRGIAKRVTGLLALSILMFAGRANADRIAIYVDGMRVGEYETHDPLWWWDWNPWPVRWPWSGGFDGAGRVVIGLGTDTVVETLQSFDFDGGAAQDGLQVLLDHPANIDLYANSSAEGEVIECLRPPATDYLLLTLDDGIAEAFFQPGAQVSNDLLAGVGQVIWGFRLHPALQVWARLPVDFNAGKHQR